MDSCEEILDVSMKYISNFCRQKFKFLVACGDNYTVAITNDGKVYSCGNNDYGQLGHELARKRLREYNKKIKCR